MWPMVVTMATMAWITAFFLFIYESKEEKINIWKTSKKIIKFLKSPQKMLKSR